MALTPGMASAAFASNALYPRMRHRTEQQFAEQHAFRAKILGVLRIARDFGIEIRGLVVLADQFVSGAVDALGSLGGVRTFLVIEDLILLSKRRPPHILRPAHQRRQNLVVILAAAEISRDSVRQFQRVGLGFVFKYPTALMMKPGIQNAH
jgi:hypothetical protein